jgi:hypothetical protein
MDEEKLSKNQSFDSLCTSTKIKIFSCAVIERNLPLFIILLENVQRREENRWIS